MAGLPPPPGTRRVAPVRSIRRSRAAFAALLSVATMGAAIRVAVASPGAPGPVPVQIGSALVVESSGDDPEGDVGVDARSVAQAAVATVTGRACEGHTGGSGWYLADGRLVTASHVVDGASAVLVQGAGGVAHGDLERMSWPVGDLSVAAVDAVVAEPLALGENPDVGDSAVMAGIARDGRVHVVPGTVIAVVPASDFGLDGDRLIVVDTLVEPGMSGGPTVGTDGRVIGVIRAVEQASGVTLVTPVEELWVLLDVNREPMVAVDCD